MLSIYYALTSQENVTVANRRFIKAFRFMSSEGIARLLNIPRVVNYGIPEVLWTLSCLVDCLPSIFKECLGHTFTFSYPARPNKRQFSRTVVVRRAVMAVTGSLSCLHSENTGVKTWPGKGPLGPNSIPGQRWPGISQLDAEYDPELAQSDPIVCQVCRKLTDFRVIVDPEWSLAHGLAPMDPFPGHADPGVECVANAGLFGAFWRESLIFSKAGNVAI